MLLSDPKILHRLAYKGIPESELRSMIPEPYDLNIELLKAQGMNLELTHGIYRFKTADSPIDDTVFCIVDIETNGSKPQRDQIIEIGAVKIQNYCVIDTYESLVYCKEISEQIQDITGISVEQTLKAPPMSKVMREFRLFLEDTVFVGHDVKFDYNFISAMMERVGLNPLRNRALCTIDLAERTLESERYGLAYLNEQLELYKEATHHRALSDALTTAKLLKRILRLVPNTIQKTEELISFSKEAKRLKRPKPVVKTEKEAKGE